MRVNIRATVAAAAVAVATLLTAVPAQAAVEPEAGQPVVLYQNLQNPRGMAFGPDGGLYIAEAGLGDGLTGDGPCIAGGEGESCLGMTGSVGRWKNGQFTRVVDGLPSLAPSGGASAIGPSDVDFADGFGLLTIGLGADPAQRALLPKAAAGKLGHLVAFRPGAPAVSDLADLAGYEAKANPDGGEPDSNPTGVAIGLGGAAVTDAGGNTLLLVAGKDKVKTLAVFPDRLVPAPPFIGPPGTMIPMQAVPTGVAYHDGAYYVAQLTGFPFPVGEAKIYKVVPGKKPVVYASGLTNLMDLAFAADGTLYAIEIAHNSLLAPHPVGDLLRIRPGKSPQVVLANINVPGGLAVKDGYAYVTDCSVCAQTGRLLKIKL